MEAREYLKLLMKINYLSTQFPVPQGYGIFATNLAKKYTRKYT